MANNYKEQWESAKTSLARLRNKYKQTEEQTKGTLQKMVHGTVTFFEVNVGVAVAALTYGMVDNPDDLKSADGILGIVLWGSGMGLMWFDEQDDGMHVSDHVRNVGTGMFAHFTMRQSYNLAAYIKNRNHLPAPQRTSGAIDSGRRYSSIPSPNNGGSLSSPRAPVRPRDEVDVLNNAASLINTSP
jgi:hypothetical protein